MQISMYQASVPLFLQILGNLSAILDKAAAYCESKKIAPETMTSTRLIPDMFPLARQIQIATDQAKGCAARLAGIDVPSYADTETTFEELKARLAKTMDFLKSVKPAQIDGSEGRQIKLKLGGQDMTFSGQQYLLHFVFPNFYFHATTAYDILRQAGVQIGKTDFVGKV
jgi:hypothetical protein